MIKILSFAMGIIVEPIKHEQQKIASTGGLFITIVGTFPSKTTCDGLDKLIAMKVS